MDEELYNQTVKKAANLVGFTAHSLFDRLKKVPEQVPKIDAIVSKARDDVMACMKLPEPKKKAEENDAQ